MTEEQKLCLKAQGFKEDIKAHNIGIINAVENKLDAYKIGRYDGYIAGYHECQKEYEWHYVKDGDIPKDEEYKWCVSRGGYPYIAKYEELFVSWRDREGNDVLCPYVWKEIVLPKEIE